MGLNNFFTINFPYGIQRNDSEEWCAFNREYKPLGFSERFEIYDFEKFPLYTKYKNFNIDKITKLIKEDIGNVHIDNKGNIQKIFFYNDATNPSIHPKYWNDYFRIIEELSKLIRKN